jgi:hypothetical protein
VTVRVLYTGHTAVFPVMTHSATGMKCFASTAVDDCWL